MTNDLKIGDPVYDSFRENWGIIKTIISRDEVLVDYGDGVLLWAPMSELTKEEMPRTMG